MAAAMAHANCPKMAKPFRHYRNQQLPQEFANYIYPALSAYWGAQPGTSGTVYLGALICLLFIVGIFVVKSWHKGWIIAAKHHRHRAGLGQKIRRR